MVKYRDGRIETLFKDLHPNDPGPFYAYMKRSYKGLGRRIQTTVLQTVFGVFVLYNNLQTSKRSNYPLFAIK